MKDFQIKDRVHWTRNGNTTPGTVIRRTKTRVYVRRDTYDFQQSYFEHDQACLNPDAAPAAYCVIKGDLNGPVLCFTLRSNEQWILQGHKVPMSGNRLKSGWKACPK